MTWYTYERDELKGISNQGEHYDYVQITLSEWSDSPDSGGFIYIDSPLFAENTKPSWLFDYIREFKTTHLENRKVINKIQFLYEKYADCEWYEINYLPNTI